MTTATSAPAPAPVPAPVPSIVASSAPSAEWPIPSGWKSETIPFPLPFAPELSYRGVEQLRFAPHFFDAKAETYFSYSFAWLLEGAEELPAARLSADVGRYFSGLAHAVDEGRWNPKAHDASLTTDPAGHVSGVVHTVDAFGDGRALTLQVDGQSELCAGHRVLLLSLSPKSLAHPTWNALKAQRASFPCRDSALDLGRPHG